MRSVSVLFLACLFLASCGEPEHKRVARAVIELQDSQLELQKCWQEEQRFCAVWVCDMFIRPKPGQPYDKDKGIAYIQREYVAGRIDPITAADAWMVMHGHERMFNKPLYRPGERESEQHKLTSLLRR